MTFNDCIPSSRLVAMSAVRLCCGAAIVLASPYVPGVLASKAAAFVGHAFLFLGALGPFSHAESIIVGGAVDRAFDAMTRERHRHEFGPYYEAAVDDVVYRCNSCGISRGAS